MKYFIPFFLLFLAACSSTPKKEVVSDPNQEVVGTPVEIPRDDNGLPEEQIDQVGLQKWLGLSRRHNQLGFKEKSFNTCQVGYGYSKSHNCRTHHFVVINYRLQCRDSEGTVTRALTSADLRNISHAKIKWLLKNQDGITQTNGDGYGQIAAIFPSSPRGQRLRLGLEGELLYIRTGDVNSIVAPGSWCQF